MADEEFSVSVSSDGGTVSAKGESVSRVVDALAGFLSPISEGAGYFGDVIRMYRQENVIRGVAKAKKLADNLGVPIQPVHPKFLVNWVEGVSLEDEVEKEDPLTEMWAGLLVSASQNLKPGHHLYRRILSELTTDHAEFIQLFLPPEQHGPSLKLFQDVAIKINGFFGEKEIQLTADQIGQVAMIERINSLEGPGVFFSQVSLHASSGGVPTKEKLIWTSDSPVCREFESSHVIQMLVTNGIILETSWIQIIVCPEYFDQFETKWKKKKGYLEVRAYALTPMGRDFVLACQGVLP